MAERIDEGLAQKLGELIETLQALKAMGRQLTAKEERLAELARTQPRPKAAVSKPAPAPRGKPAPTAPSTPTPAVNHDDRPRGNPFVSAPADLETIRAAMGDCRRCGLWEGRTKLVFGDGSPAAELMFVGEGPGADEDAKGLPFVGRAGQLLNDMIAAMGRQRGEVYIANIVKSRPPGNREPAPDEVAACLPFLRQQIQVIRPKVIVCLGRVAVQNLLETKTPISRLRGQWQLYHDIKVMPTFHPAYLLRNPDAKKPAWEDLKLVMAELGWPLPRRKRG